MSSTLVSTSPPKEEVALRDAVDRDIPSPAPRGLHRPVHNATTCLYLANDDSRIQRGRLTSILRYLDAVPPSSQNRKLSNAYRKKCARKPQGVVHDALVDAAQRARTSRRPETIDADSVHAHEVETHLMEMPLGRV